MASLSVLANDLGELARGLRQAGDTDLLGEVKDAIQHAAGPIPDTIRSELRPRLPDRYADVLNADLSLQVVTRTGRYTSGVSIIGRGRGAVQRRRLHRLDSEGILEHPLFGNRRHWYRQPVQAGFFTDPNEAAAPRVRSELEAALERVKEKIWAGVHG